MAMPRKKTGNYWTYGVCAILIAAAGIAFQAGAEGPIGGPMRVGGYAPVKAVRPPNESRPTDSGDVPLTRARPADDREPVSSFIESLNGADSAFQVILGQSRMFTTREPIAKDGGVAALAVSDPSILEFEVMPNPRMIRLMGRRAGVTDLTFTTSDNKMYSFEVHVVYDLDLLRAQLKQSFPDAYIKLGQMREHLILEGQARSTDQIGRIVQILDAFLLSMQVRSNEQLQQLGQGGAGQSGSTPRAGGGPAMGGNQPGADGQGAGGQGDPNDPNNSGQGGQAADNGQGGGNDSAVVPFVGRTNSRATITRPQVINLMTVPGAQQVLLQVQVAELNRTALREMGTDWLLKTPNTIIGTQLTGAGASADSLLLGPATTGFAIFPSGELTFMVRALRRNSVLNVLAEPNLVTMHGQEASFLAGGEFAVPVPQIGGGGGVAALTIQFKQFGVQLNFVPYILDDETIRLKVNPEVSTLDEATGTEVAGTLVPGIATRRVNTTVELRQGQSLALAGLLTVSMEGQTSRIPLLGDLPYIGSMFSNTSHKRQEKELVVLVTPHLVTPMNPGQVPALPGDDIMAPNDLEFYLLGRIEGRTARFHRPTTTWDNALGLVQLMKLERSHLCGPVGYSELEDE